MKKLFEKLFFAEKTFRKWFISSMMVLFIFIISGILLYLGALYVTKQVILMAQEQSAEQAKILIEVELLNIKKDISALTLNNRIVSAAYRKPPFTGNDYYNYHRAGEELIGIYSYKNVKDIYVYYSKGECFAGSYNLIYDKIESFTQDRFGMSNSAWKKFAIKQGTNVFLKKEDSIYYFCPLQKNGDREVTCLAVVELDLENLHRVLFTGNTSAQGESYSYIVSSNNDLIATTGNSATLKYGYGTLNLGNNYIDENVVTCKQIEYTDWEYISVAPITQYLKEIYDLHNILYVYIGIIIILSSGIVYIDTRRRFHPVQKLRSNIQSGDERNKSIQAYKYKNQDIFLIMQDAIKDIVYDNTKMKTKLKREKDILLGQQFTEMMENCTGNEEDAHCFEDSFSMRYQQGIVVLATEMSIGNKLNDISIEERDNILLLCLNNIGTELLGENYKCFFWKYVKITGVIWSNQEEEICSNLYMLNILEQIRICIKQYFDVELCFALSNLCHSPLELASAHREAKAAYEYSYVTGKIGIIRYDESYTQIFRNWKNTDVIQAEQDFMSYMMEHNYERAKIKLEIIIGYYGYADGASIQLLKCRMFGLINLMLNAIEMEKTPDEDQFYINLNPVQRLLEASTIYNLENEIMSIIEALILHYNEREETTERKLEYIDRYIEAHYADQGLSVQQLADCFQLSFPYLSKIYKLQKGMGVLEVINTCRIRHVKELLIQEPDMSLANIAERVGYGNVQTMIRIFKKMQKQTPGQYRTQARK